MISWIKNLNFKNMVSPFHIKHDSEYLRALTEKYELLEEIVSDADAESIHIVGSYTKSILSAVNSYYSGDLRKAQDIIQELIRECVSYSYVVTNVNECPAYAWSKEIQFFRARLAEDVMDFPADEMLHIPFNKREKVGSERFSIPGLPCLYLGNSSYACWIEMGCPADHKFNVAPVKLDNTQKVFNLCVGIRDLFQFEDADESEPDIADDIHNVLRALVMEIATSFIVEQEGRQFKSEYIIPQLIMLACKSEGLDGVTYYSKRVSDEMFARVVGINVALFAEYEVGENLSPHICNHVEIGDSFNFSMYKNLKQSLKYQSYNLNVSACPLINNVGSFKRQFPYKETEFFFFDQYLFAAWGK